MVNANVENTPVSEVVDLNSSLTVPSGEVWDVTIMVGNRERDSSSTNVQVNLNGSNIFESRDGGAHTHVILTGGDTIQPENYDGGITDPQYVGIHISGFVVN